MRGSGGCLVWITGRPSSGKTTLASAVRGGLARRGVPSVVLDGDVVRREITPQLGYSPADRDAFYGTLARLAALLCGQGLIVIVAATTSRAAYRRTARELVPAFVEVLVDTPLEECERRDDKGLYALAREGRVSHLPGAHGCAFEAATEVDLVAHGGRDAAAVDRIVDRVMETQ